MDVHASSGFVPVNNNDVVALRASQSPANGGSACFDRYNSVLR